MDQPLGCSVGNALEVVEAIQTLRGEGPADLEELSIALAGEMIHLSGAAESSEAGRKMALEALSSGRGLEYFERWIEAQGGDPRVADKPGLMGEAPVVKIVESPEPGLILGVDARKIAAACLLLGAGRTRKEDSIDRRVGVVLRARRGMKVEKGQPLAEIHAVDAAAARRAAMDVLEAYSLGDRVPHRDAVVLETISLPRP
jgi:thymidine phosphorylase